MLKQYDVLILGSGTAGQSIALRLADHLRVALVTKREMADSASNWAQGGIAAVLDTTDSIEAHIQDTFMLRLDKASFTITDATLVAEAGACGDCPKRTGANPDLFKDVDSADVCTNPPCYYEKADAQTELLVRDAQDKGQHVITGQEAAELASDHWGNSKLKGYRRLDSVEDSPTDVPLRKIIGEQMQADMRQLIGQVRAVLIGHKPAAAGARVIGWQSGKVLDYDASVLLFADVYQTHYVMERGGGAA